MGIVRIRHDIASVESNLNAQGKDITKLGTKLDNIGNMQDSPTAATVASLGDLVASLQEEVASQQNCLEDLEVRTSQGFSKVEVALKLRGGYEIEPPQESESEYELEDLACDSSDVGDFGVEPNASSPRRDAVRDG